MDSVKRRARGRTVLRTVDGSDVAGRPVTAANRTRRRGPVLECGGCGAPVVRGFSPDELAGILMRCVGCGAINEAVL